MGQTRQLVDKASYSGISLSLTYTPVTLIASSKLKFFTKSWKLLKISAQPSSCSFWIQRAMMHFLYHRAKTAGSLKLLKMSKITSFPWDDGYAALYCCHTNKPALFITVQTHELFLPTAKHFQTKWHCSFDPRYISVLLAWVSHQVQATWCSVDVWEISSWSVKAKVLSFHSYIPNTKCLGIFVK